jgi:hypothetical protein
MVVSPTNARQTSEVLETSEVSGSSHYYNPQRAAKVAKKCHDHARFVLFALAMVGKTR